MSKIRVMFECHCVGAVAGDDAISREYYCAVHHALVMIERVYVPPKPETNARIVPLF